MPGIDERRLERFTLDLVASISVTSEEGAEKDFKFNTSDISSGGAFFNTDKPLPVGTELRLDMVLPLDKLKKLKGKQAKIEVSGAVVRITQEGMAISFKKDYQIKRYRKQSKVP